MPYLQFFQNALQNYSMHKKSLRDDGGRPTPADASAVWRPALFFVLVAATIAAFLWLGATALSAGGFGPIDLLLVLLFAITLPWYVIGFWNATLGLLVMRFASDPVAAVTPVISRLTGSEPITASTAVLLCIRNEPPDRVGRLLEPLLAGLDASGFRERFHIYILSDTDMPDIAVAEETRFRALATAWRDRLALTYRRRASNVGYKAGNIRDFCERWGGGHDFALMLDADSAMTVPLLLKLVRIMQLDPRMGILQSLVVGMPAASPFARIFQFGMRLSMRSYTVGSAWWQGDCGPYWGHNAIVRLAPFTACCNLPVLDERALVKGHVLSHDQIEAVLMRKAGFKVQVLTEEGESFEQNPPTLIEFIRRDLRWCQGNMQYWHFLGAPGLHPVSRYQLALAILMFLGSPAWMGLLLMGSIAMAMAPAPADFMRADAGVALLLLVLAMWFAPNVATVIHVLTRPQERRLFGGSLRFAASFAITVIFVLLLAPITWASHTLFLARLLSGRRIVWTTQTRDDHVVPWRLAVRELWPQTMFGLAPICLLAVAAPAAIPYALFIAAGPLLAIPFAVATASPSLGRALIALGLDRLPEETEPPRELLALDVPALSRSLRVRPELAPATVAQSESRTIACPAKVRTGFAKKDMRKQRGRVG
jgi:membrane glycosyltransferase